MGYNQLQVELVITETIFFFLYDFDSILFVWFAKHAEQAVSNYENQNFRPGLVLVGGSNFSAKNQNYSSFAQLGTTQLCKTWVPLNTGIHWEHPLSPIASFFFFFCLWSFFALCCLWYPLMLVMIWDLGDLVGGDLTWGYQSAIARHLDID